MTYDSQLGNDKIKVSSSAVISTQLRKLVRALLWAFVILFVVYVCFAATLVRVIPSTSGTGAILSNNVTYEGGMIPAGAVLVVDTTRDNDGTILRNLETAFIPSSDYKLVEVYAGPYGEFGIDGESNETVFEGEEVGFPLSQSTINNREENFLAEEYLVKCLDGACSEGEGYIVSREDIVGEQIAFSEIFGGTDSDEEDANTAEQEENNGSVEDGDS